MYFKQKDIATLRKNELQKEVMAKNLLIIYADDISQATGFLKHNDEIWEV